MTDQERVRKLGWSYTDGFGEYNRWSGEDLGVRSQQLIASEFAAVRREVAEAVKKALLAAGHPLIVNGIESEPIYLWAFEVSVIVDKAVEGLGK